MLINVAVILLGWEDTRGEVCSRLCHVFTCSVNNSTLIVLYFLLLRRRRLKSKENVAPC